MCLEHLNHTVQMEQRSPFTLNTQTFLERKQAILDTLSTAQGADLNRESVKKALIALNEVGIRGLTPQTLLNRLQPCPDTHLLDLMATFISYSEISTVRFIDQICLQTDYHFLLRFSELLEKELVHSLGILEKEDGEMCKMLEEDRVVVEKRQRFLERRVRLESVWKELHEFGLIV